MSIEVVSASEPAVQAEKPAVQVGDASKSAPVAAKAAEQNDPATSDTATEEAKQADEIEKDDADADGDEPETDASEKDKTRKKSGSQRRKERAERAEAEVERLRKVVEDMALKGAGDSRTEQAPKAEATKAVGDAGKPNPDAFDSYTEYTEALTDWKIEQREKAREAAAEQSRRESQQREQMNAHSERVKAFAAEHVDFDDVLAEVADLPLSPSVEHLLLTSETGPALMYELAKNVDEFKRINALDPLAAARELGRLESRLTPASDSSRPEPKKQTKAPAPIVPVGSKGGSVPKTIHDPNLSQSEYERLRAKQRSS